MTWYLSGPMKGQPGHGKPRLNEIAAELRGNGFTVETPMSVLARHLTLDEQDAWGKKDPDAFYQFALGKDLEFICRTETRGIVLSPGWQGSVGCNTELFVARMAGKIVAELVPPPRGRNSYFVIPPDQLTLHIPSRVQPYAEALRRHMHFLEDEA